MSSSHIPVLFYFAFRKSIQLYLRMISILTAHYFQWYSTVSVGYCNLMENHTVTDII